ncbi:hypothetical protein [Cohnella rhizosphaerae]|uniref:Uncharacterized protein n=1 Tax=Cohnella rhizosphaerae TaxID=1457232 RepID=A0A9X4KRI4_9BACL|nr:hypothetical protein [Cohnella rhizosphaerae]MDG0809228.1 hypothetical protein [Cohnella rhizosphaerae]
MGETQAEETEMLTEKPAMRQADMQAEMQAEKQAEKQAGMQVKMHAPDLGSDPGGGEGGPRRGSERRGGARAALRKLGALLLATALMGASASAAGATVYPRASQQAGRRRSITSIWKVRLIRSAICSPSSRCRGIVNRSEPRIWVLKNPIQMYDAAPGFDAYSTMVGRTFWFDRLSGYTKVAHTDPLELVQSFASELSGAVLYDPDMLDTASGANGNVGSFYYTTNDDSQYAEANKGFQPSETVVAQLNVTAMLCAKYGAIALTEDQLDALADDYGVTLPVLADTRTLDLSTWQKKLPVRDGSSGRGHADRYFGQQPQLQHRDVRLPDREQNFRL